MTKIQQMTLQQIQQLKSTIQDKLPIELQSVIYEMAGPCPKQVQLKKQLVEQLNSVFKKIARHNYWGENKHKTRVRLINHGDKLLVMRRVCVNNITRQGWGECRMGCLSNDGSVKPIKPSRVKEITYHRRHGYEITTLCDKCQDYYQKAITNNDRDILYDFQRWFRGSRKRYLKKEPEPESEYDSEPEPDSEPEVSDSEPEPDSEPESDYESDSEPEPESDYESDSDSEPED